MDNRWYPTNDLRWVVNKRGDSFMQQRWVGSFVSDEDNGVLRSIRREEQWRIIPVVNFDDLTPEERGITRLADWPTASPASE